MLVRSLLIMVVVVGVVFVVVVDHAGMVVVVDDDVFVGVGVCASLVRGECLAGVWSSDVIVVFSCCCCSSCTWCCLLVLCCCLLKDHGSLCLEPLLEQCALVVAASSTARLRLSELLL